MAAKHPDRKIPRPASRPLETLTKIAAQNLDGFLFMAYLLSRTVVLSVPAAEIVGANCLSCRIIMMSVRRGILIAFSYAYRVRKERHL